MYGINVNEYVYSNTKIKMFNVIQLNWLKLTGRIAIGPVGKNLCQATILSVGWKFEEVVIIL